MLSVIKYIRTNGLEKTIEDFKLKASYGYKKVHLKYNQIESDYKHEEVRDCRGLILEMDTWKVMCMSFYKFFNFQEIYAAKIDWETAHILEKLDGCLQEDTIIITEDGEKTIKWVCETEYSGKIISFDLESNEFYWDEIIGHSIKKNIGNWFEIELEDGTKITLTGNHRVWLSKLNCYRRVDELSTEDEFLLIDGKD